MKRAYKRRRLKYHSLYSSTKTSSFRITLENIPLSLCWFDTRRRYDRYELHRTQSLIVPYTTITSINDTDRSLVIDLQVDVIKHVPVVVCINRRIVFMVLHRGQHWSQQWRRDKNQILLVRKESGNIHGRKTNTDPFVEAKNQWVAEMFVWRKDKKEGPSNNSKNSTMKHHHHRSVIHHSQSVPLMTKHRETQSYSQSVWYQKKNWERDECNSMMGRSPIIA